MANVKQKKSPRKNWRLEAEKLEKMVAALEAQKEATEIQNGKFKEILEQVKVWIERADSIIDSIPNWLRIFAPRFFKWADFVADTFEKLVELLNGLELPELKVKTRDSK